MTLWHVSEDPAIPRFEPRANPEHDSPEPLVWAIDDQHVPAYWFARDCPRATFWAVDSTAGEDVEWFLTGDRRSRVHALQSDWLEQFRARRPQAATCCNSVTRVRHRPCRIRRPLAEPFSRYCVSLS